MLLVLLAFMEEEKYCIVRTFMSLSPLICVFFCLSTCRCLWNGLKQFIKSPQCLSLTLFWHLVDNNSIVRICFKELTYMKVSFKTKRQRHCCNCQKTYHIMYHYNVCMKSSIEKRTWHVWLYLIQRKRLSLYLLSWNYSLILNVPVIWPFGLQCCC